MRTRSELLAQLAELKRQIEHGDNIIDAQQRVVDALQVRGAEASQAQYLLDCFQQSQEIRVREMDRPKTPKPLRPSASILGEMSAKEKTIRCFRCVSCAR